MVTHYAWRRRDSRRARALFRRLAGVWMPFLGIYAAVLGSRASGSGEGRPADEFWMGLNLWLAGPLRVRRDDLEAPPAGYRSGARDRRRHDQR